MANASAMNMQEQIDAYIFQGAKLSAILAIRTVMRCDLATAIAELGNRYKFLRENLGHRFECDDAKYWEGFYS